jgi:hypothetical protein
MRAPISASYIRQKVMQETLSIQATESAQLIGLFLVMLKKM